MVENGIEKEQKVEIEEKPVDPLDIEFDVIKEQFENCVHETIKPKGYERESKFTCS